MCFAKFLVVRICSVFWKERSQWVIKGCHRPDSRNLWNLSQRNFFFGDNSSSLCDNINQRGLHALSFQTDVLSSVRSLKFFFRWKTWKTTLRSSHYVSSINSTTNKEKFKWSSRSCRTENQLVWTALKLKEFRRFAVHGFLISETFIR